jgi:hypothetical protein
VNELPPDAPRLRAILQYLDQQAADNEVVGIYLRLQRDAVRTALAKAEAQQPRQQTQPRPPRPPLTQLPTYAQGLLPARFKVVQRETDDGVVLVSLHQGDCDIDAGPTQWVDAHDAAVALSDGMAGCVYCRPYELLGLSSD